VDHVLIHDLTMAEAGPNVGRTTISSIIQAFLKQHVFQQCALYSNTVLTVMLHITVAYYICILL